MMASNQDYIDLFYNCTTKLMELKTQAATDQHEDSYKKLLQAPHWTGQTQLKAMSSQYISEYANYFPGLHNEAFNTQIDFCEDDNNTVRLEGIKSLFTIAIALPSLAIKSADVLVQLLQSEIPDEDVSVRKSLLLLFRKFPKDCTLAILGQIQSGLDSVRDAASSFIRKQLLVELQPKMKTKFLKKLIPIVSVTVITNELATLVFELLSCAELEFDGDDDLISFADAATHRLLSYLFELDPVRVDTLFVLLDQYKKLFGYGMPSDKTISAILNYCLGDNSKVTFSPSQKLALLKYVTECTLFIIDSSNVEASFDQELLEQLLDDCMVKIPQTGGEFSAHLLMLEPVLYCMLYFRMKIPVMDRQISTQLYKKLGIIYSKLEELIIASGVTNQSSTSQKVKLFSNNTKAICGELLKGKNLSETFELKISWKLPIPIAQAQSKYSIQPASEKSIAQHVNVRSKASKGQKVYKKRPGSGVGPKEAIKKDSTTIVNTMITGSHPSTLGHTPISNTSPPVMKKIRMISFGNLPAVRPCSERNLSKIQISREIPREKPRQIKSSTQAKPKIVRQ